MSFEKSKLFAIITIVSTISIGLGIQQVIAFIDEQSDSDFAQISTRIDKNKEFLEQCNFSEEGHELILSLIIGAEKELYLSDKNNIDYDEIENRLKQSERYLNPCEDPCQNGECVYFTSFYLDLRGIGYLMIITLIFIIIAIVFAIKWIITMKNKQSAK